MNLQTNYFILYDAIFFVVSLLICIHAYRKGLFAQIFGIVAFVASFIVAWLSYDHFAQMTTLVHSPYFTSALNQLAWFFLCFIGCRILLSIFRHILFIDKKKKHGPLSFINHLGGLCIGLLEVCVVLQCWFAFVELPFVENGKAYEAQSMVLKGKNVLQEEVKLLWNTKIRPSITN